MASNIKLLGCQLNTIDPETLIYFQQLGITDIQYNTPDIPGEKTWAFEDIKAYKEKTESYGVKLVCIENVPIRFYDKVMLGLPGRDEQIENYIGLIRSFGKLGITYFGYHFTPTFVWRTSYEAKTRGGARVSAYNDEAARRDGNRVAYAARLDVEIPDPEDMWKNHEYFMKAILPEAEKAGVKMALHPDDPPVACVSGVARIFNSFESYVRADRETNSPAWGVDLCLGCCSEMGGAPVVERFIDYFGHRVKIFYVHFRDVLGVPDDFRECYLGEGNYNPARVMRKLKESGFKGYVCEDHVPIMENDSKFGHRARAYEIGKLQGLISMMDYDDEK